jgi:hypothetical protein
MLNNGVYMDKLKRILSNKSFISLIITLSIVVSLVFLSSPAQAINVLVTNSASAFHSSPYTFYVSVHIENSDLLPIQHIDLQIYNTANPGSYRIDYVNLPVPSVASGNAIGSYSGSFGQIDVLGTGDANWGYGSGNRYGYGYGYSSQQYSLDKLGYGYGYGFRDGSLAGLATLEYSITWTPSSTFPVGTYNIRVLVYGNSTTAFTHEETCSFVLYAAPATQVPISGGGGGAEAEPGVTFVNNFINTQGVFIQSVVAKSADQNVSLNIPLGTIGKTKEGAPLTYISLKQMVTPPPPPLQSNVIGLTYDLGPEGATFDPPITLTFTYDPSRIPAGVNERDLVIAFYNKTTGQWENLTDIVVDPVTHTISGKAGHFTAFAVLAVPPTTTPAAVTPKPTTPAPTIPAAVTPAPTTPAPATPAVGTPAPTTPVATTPAAVTPVPATPVNWTLIISLIVAAIIVIGLLFYFLWWRKRTV